MREKMSVWTHYFFDINLSQKHQFTVSLESHSDTLGCDGRGRQWTTTCPRTKSSVPL
jgi:hypothetical protein